MNRLLLLMLVLTAAPGLAAQNLPSWAEPYVPPPVERQAHDLGPVDDCGGFPCPPPDPVPVDGGLGLLALAGGAYAVRRLRKGS
ncbi:MAG TPA: hypothetical protein VK002_16295 [Rubricoccaceae bacterium]|jgi:hypothetical protein|nr:hypothetical protein [Rubricoccaceae bacterium]